MERWDKCIKGSSYYIALQLESNVSIQTLFNSKGKCRLCNKDKSKHPWTSVVGYYCPRLPMLKEGWDRNYKTGLHHWYKDGSPICGSDTGLSAVFNRVKVLPQRARACKRCVEGLKARNIGVLRLVKG